MVSLNVYDIENNKVDELQVSDSVFDVEPDKGVLHEVVKWQLASRRAGTACTKTRAEVRGGGRKPWRQKGTGRARVGSTRNPLWRHGGVAFGPKPRDFSYSLPKKVRRLGLKMVLTDKLRSDRLRVVRELKLDEIRTARMARVLQGFDALSSAVLVLDGDDKVVELSARNLPGVKVLRKEGLNVYDLLKYEYVIVQEPAIAAIEERLA